MAFYQGRQYDLRSDPNAIGNFGRMGLELMGLKARKDADNADNELRREQQGYLRQLQADELEYQKGQDAIQNARNEKNDSVLNELRKSQMVENTSGNTPNYAQAFSVNQNYAKQFVDKDGNITNPAEYKKAMEASKINLKRFNDTVNGKAPINFSTLQDRAVALARFNFPNASEAEVQMRAEAYLKNMQNKGYTQDEALRNLEIPGRESLSETLLPRK